MAQQHRVFLTPAERLELIRDGFYSLDPGLRRRSAVLLALDRGGSLTEVARSAGCSRDSIYRWLSNYLEQRDPAALSDNRGRFTDKPWQRRRLLIARATALAALVAAQTMPPGPGRLGLTLAARAALAALAQDSQAEPRDRYRAALLWALDAGIPKSTIARTASCDRKTVRMTPVRHLRRILAKAFLKNPELLAENNRAVAMETSASPVPPPSPSAAATSPDTSASSVVDPIPDLTAASYVITPNLN